MADVVPNTPAALEFLRLWRPGGPWLLTAILPGGKEIASRTFREGDPELEKWIDQYNGVRNIYFSVNPTVRDMTLKAKKEDIEAGVWLHVDIDPREREPLAEEQERIRSLIDDMPKKGVPRPSVVIFSGGGYQAFWRLDEAFEIRGNVERANEFERYTRQLAIVFGGDNCFNVDRIMRVPGTVNVPTTKKLREGRVPALAETVYFDEELSYPLSKFIQAAELQTVGGDFASSPSGHTVNVSGNIAFLESIHDLDRWGVSDRIKQLIVQGDLRHTEGPKQRDDSRSAWLFDAVCAMVRAEVPDDVMFSVIMDPSHGISASILDKGVNAQKHAIHAITNAKEEAINPRLRELNAKHAVIANLAGKCRVVEEVMDYALNRTRLTRQSFDDFRNRYMNNSVVIATDPQKGEIKMPVGKWWLLHPNRRQFETIVFAPNRDVHGAYNMWKGFAVTAKPGDCSLFLEHVRRNICQGSEQYYTYLLGWMARAVQHPDSPGQTALVLRGRMGTGKSFFAKTFGSLWGRHFLQVSDPKHLVGSFNAHLRDCVVLFGDEAFYAGDKKHESILKTLVTEETIIIEGKGVDAEAAPNYTHIILASNAQWVVPAGGDERRYFVLDVGHDQMQNSAYFKAIARELDAGGREALLHHLTTLDLSEFDVRAVPKTAALQDQKLLSLAPEEEWWFGKLEEGRLLGDQDEWVAEVMKDTLLDDYIEYMKRLGVQRRATSTSLGKFLSRVCPGVFPRSYQKFVDLDIPTDNGYTRKVRRRAYFYEFPPLADARGLWDDTFGPVQWAENQPPLPLDARQERPEPF